MTDDRTPERTMEPAEFTIPAATLDAFEKFIAQQGNVSVEELVRRLRSDAQQRLLERAIVPRSFTREIADRVLLPGLENTNATWDWLIAQPEIESARAFPGEYHARDSVRDEGRKALLEEGGADAERWERFVATSRALVDALDVHDERQSVERIYHLVVAAPDECARAFRTAFDAANDANDFSECEYLIATVRSQLPYALAHGHDRATALTTFSAVLQLGNIVDDKERFYKTRRRFAEELRRSAHTLARDFMKEEARAIGQPTKQWIVNVESEGGRGKTVFINWLVATQLVPAHVPVAKVDFDAPTWSSRQYSAWEFLLHVALELDAQLPGAPFASLIDEIRAGLSSDRDVSSSQTRRGGGARNVVLESELAEDIPARLGRAIAEVTPGPVVVILDTLEELKLRNLASLADVVDTFSRVHARCQNLRLYLSGRFNLAERHPDMWELFSGDVRVLHIPDFDDDEAIDFLIDVRKLTDRPLAAAIATKTDCRPFQLALAADLVQSRGGLTLGEVESLGDLDLVYLVRRVLRRIEDPRVKWLVRYGVVPRALTRSFVEQVMLPELRIALSGDKTHDDPDSDPHDLLRDGQQFVPTGDTTLDVGELWTLLESYASRCSFVSLSVDGSGALVFHGDVRLPMRRVLQQKAAGHPDSVYHRLHESARSIALAEAAMTLGNDDARWGEAMSRALYHAFQRSSACGDETWKLARTAMASGAPSDEACARVASELSQPEYVGDDGLPLMRGDDTPMLRTETLAESLFEGARRVVSIARRAESERSGTATSWTRAFELLESLERLRHADRGAARAVPDAEFSLLQADVLGAAALWERKEHDPVLLQNLRKLQGMRRRSHLREADARLRFAIAIARLERSQRIDRAIDALRAELRASERVAPELRSEALMLLVEMAQGAFRLDVALAAATEHVALTRRAAPRELAAALFRLASVHWTLRDGDAALACIRECKKALGRAPIPSGIMWILSWTLQIEGEIHLWQRDYAAIDRLLAEIDEVLAAAKVGVHDPAASTALAAYAPLLAALRDITALRVDTIPQSLERARTAYEELGDHERLMLLIFMELQYCLRDMSDVRPSESLAMRVGRTRADDADSSTIRARALAHEVFVASGRPDDAGEQLAALLAGVDRLDARARVLVHTRALVVGLSPAAHARHVRGLVQALESVAPVALRMRLLADQLHPGETIPLSPSERSRIVRALGGMGAFAQWSLDRLRPATIRQAADTARVAIALGATEHVADALRALATVVRGARWRALLPIVQALELDAVRDGYVPASVARPRDVARWSGSFTPGLNDVVATVNEGALHQQLGDDDAAAACARLAVQALSERSLPLTIWHALSSELLLATSDDAEERERARGGAIEYYASRQDEVALMRLAPPPAASEAGHEPGPVAPGERARLVTRVQVVGDSARAKGLRLAHGDEQAVHPAKAPVDSDAWHALTRDVTIPTSLGIPKEALTRLLGDWPAFCSWLGSALFPAMDDRMRHDGRHAALDLILQVDPRAAILQGVPWELALAETSSSDAGASKRARGKQRAPKANRAFLDGYAPNVLLARAMSGDTLSSSARHTRWIQRMLSSLTGESVIADGILGRATKAALAQVVGDVAESPSPALSRRLIQRYARKLTLQRPRLCVVADDSVRLMQRLRGTVVKTIAARDQFFERYDESVVDTRDKSDALEMLQSRDFEVIVLSGRYRFDSRRGGVIFDFVQRNARSSEARTTGIDAPLLARALERSQRPCAPVVVVDAQDSGSASERVRGLLLRNLFCAELAARAGVAAVVGTGLDNEHHEGTSLTPLLAGLRACQSIADVVHILRAAGGDARVEAKATADALQKFLPSRGIALWCDTPHDVFIAGASPPVA